MVKIGCLIRISRAQIIIDMWIVVNMTKKNLSIFDPFSDDLRSLTGVLCGKTGWNINKNAENWLLNSNSPADELECV